MTVIKYWPSEKKKPKRPYSSIQELKKKVYPRDRSIETINAYEEDISALLLLMSWVKLLALTPNLSCLSLIMLTTGWAIAPWPVQWTEALQGQISHGFFFVRPMDTRNWKYHKSDRCSIRLPSKIHYKKNRYPLPLSTSLSVMAYRNLDTALEAHILSRNLGIYEW